MAKYYLLISILYFFSLIFLIYSFLKNLSLFIINFFILLLYFIIHILYLSILMVNKIIWNYVKLKLLHFIFLYLNNNINLLFLYHLSFQMHKIIQILINSLKYFSINLFIVFIHIYQKNQNFIFSIYFISYLLLL